MTLPLADSQDTPRNIKLTIAYDGTAYHGFQRQKNALTVQEVLENCLERLCRHKVSVAGAGRTDTGVHAYGQVVNFFTYTRIPGERIAPALKGLLPPDIVVKRAEEVGQQFHARFSAQSKVYVYRIYQQETADPFLRHYAWHIRHKLNVEAIHSALQVVVGTHDFSAFQAAGGPRRDPVKTILSAACRREESILELSFWGTGFLYHMVRNLVGTLIEVGMDKLSKADFSCILAGGDRTKAGMTAPPQGLYLKEIFY
ncbi:tRNA pseudouridine synthase A [Propionispora sp. 2/2-37]|uniref:tRNA pseudouridine(38-40) synthase TruA n=1 Tax=Propionispora sp. 2/2-37 TaxID=1677858 RepID=UPI0006BB8C66|nr:tRNA pseudouridine(38-40) synthase TruA [Propionispora sp. 2/2-37]CUH95183.1 tRNA pseudouridine synthase A [Propionispora sp. 2/2-37]